ncbi:hypothetical protein TVAG_331280 [Trichomonas vaginalis G3]|uniref:GP63-like n=1 Tax=Trichomonas vaginalis (strain ATCC PRA-98 / G3) TaxID=412133 RepID=A2FC46_TRIV3|nr:regulation of choline O-acetyltransferase protein [Trichomonas vaginalis G3]EAX97541.1 hypothetical protein TVAG_331280 [Trichomonas vaginalis G3]KAI5512939.1 regulation of choline O-acetyltransferase protein [Trichomonas vaginalis G3]|eukprot:XP_001310471.1 hypothetical protein [Trichomonas vaginalis G3]
MRVTDVTLAFFLDSGNYEVDWSMAQPLIYGNKDSIDGNYISGWPLSAPQNVLPDNYFYDPSQELNTAGYDFNTWGSLNTQTVDCSNKDTIAKQHYCNNPSFYNPKGYSIAGRNDALDFQMVKVPSFTCPA